jgi:hypothetical protein
MDYVTRQFIVLTKKLRKEVRKALEILHKDSQKQIEAIQEARNAYEQGHNAPQVLRAELQVPHPIEVETRPKDKKSGREWYKIMVETLTLLGVLAYAAVAVRQWREMISARHQNEKVIQKTEESIVQNKMNTYLDQRAWVSVEDISMTPQAKQPLSVGFRFTNSGKTPAINAYIRDRIEPMDNSPNILSLCAEAVRIKESKFVLAPAGHNAVVLPFKAIPFPKDGKRCLCHPRKSGRMGASFMTTLFRTRTGSIVTG